jgi:uncharacterized membrane protein
MQVSMSPTRRVWAATRGLRTLLPSMVGLMGGTALAALLLWVDRSGVVPVGDATIATGAARDFLAALSGAAVTVTMLLVWVRGMLIQMMAGKLSMRVMRWYLDDWYLHVYFALLLGLFAYAVTVLLALSPTDPTAPFLSTLVGAVLAGVQLLLVVVLLHQSVYETEVGQVLSSMTALALSVIREEHPEVAAATPDPPTSDHLPARLLITAPDSGWVTGIDERRFALTLAPDAFIRFHVAVGTFVLEGTALAEVLAAEISDRDAVQAASDRNVSIERTRETRRDVDFVVSKLTDVIVRSLQPGAGETTTAYEATTQLLLIVRELLLRAPPPLRVVYDGRVVERTGISTHADHVDAAFTEIRQTCMAVPPYVAFLVEWMTRLHGQLLSHRLPDRAALIEQEIRRIVARAADQPWSARDLERVRDASGDVLTSSLSN